MPHLVTRPAGLLLLLCSAIATPAVVRSEAPPASPAFPPEALEFFETQVRPIVVSVTLSLHRVPWRLIAVHTSSS